MVSVGLLKIKFSGIEIALGQVMRFLPRSFFYFVT